jgi:putative tryptophan/tyrosine transport system substrate-binding protein
MKRRAFIAALGGVATRPLVTRAEQARNIPVIGVLWHAGNEDEEAKYLGALRNGLNDLGYVGGQKVFLANRFAAEN